MADKWIAGAIKHPGAFSATAKKMGGMGKDGKIKKSFIEKEKNSKNSTTRKRAVLAETLSKMRNK